MPRKRPEPKATNSRGSPVSPSIGAPPVMRKTTPRTSTIVPSVVVKGLTFRNAMISPLASPTAAPAAIPAMTPAAIPASSITIAATQPASAAVEPTERSKPPPTMTKVMPMAMTAMIEDCTRMLVRLSGERKRSVMNAVATHRSMSVSSGIWPARLNLFIGYLRPLPPLVPSPRLRGEGSSVLQRRGWGEGRLREPCPCAPHPHPLPASGGEREPTDFVACPSPSSATHRRAQLRLVEARRTIERGRDAALPHGKDGVAQTHELGEIARMDQRAAAARDEISDQRMDLRLGGDVDALRGLVEEEHRDAPRQPFRQDHLLL